VRYEEKQTKSILNVHKFIDSRFWDRYSLSAYQGCEFNCIYCYARSQEYAQHFGAEDTIYVKDRAAEMLDRRITRARTLLPDVVGMSGVCDPYQPGEATHTNTRQCLEVLAKHRWPVHVLTKSPLVLRDLDTLSRIAQDTWATVSFTVTTTNEKVARFLEPNAPPPKERLRAIAEIRRRDDRIQTRVIAIPIVPFLEDGEEDIASLIAAAEEAGAQYVLFSPGMTMHGNQALRYLQRLAEQYSELLPEYERIYGFKHSGEEYHGTYGPRKSYAVRLSRRVFRVLADHKMPFRIRRYIPTDVRRENYRMAEMLLNTAFELQFTGKAWTGTFWAGQNIQNLRESLVDVARRGELGRIRNVTPEVESLVLANLGSST